MSALFILRNEDEKPQSNGAQGTNETSPAETDIPRLIPDYVVDAAKGVADGSLAGKTITREFQLDDENIALFLKSVNEGDDEKSLNMLCRFLRLNPKILLHPLISGTVYGLYQNPLLWMQSPALAEKKVAEVTKAIAEGLTHGWTVEVTKPSVLGQGRPPDMFPHLYERDGWMPTAASMEDSQDLFELSVHIMTCMSDCGSVAIGKLYARCSVPTPSKLSKNGRLMCT